MGMGDLVELQAGVQLLQGGCGQALEDVAAPAGVVGETAALRIDSYLRVGEADADDAVDEERMGKELVVHFRNFSL
jgi:hypothetical protein